MANSGSFNGTEGIELSSLLRLDRELCSAPSVWLLVEVKPFGEPLYISVLRVAHVLVLGRDPTCGLVLEGSLVSRRHALLRASESGIEVEDISKHGTLVNGEPLQGARVQAGSEIKLVVGGNRVRLRRLG
jgi:hypothetical protein